MSKTLRELFDRMANLGDIQYILGLRQGIETAFADPEKAKQILQKCIDAQPDIDEFLAEFSEANKKQADMHDFLSWKKGNITEEEFRKRQKERSAN